MSDFKADFQKHHSNAGKAFAKGDTKGAASSMGHAFRALKKPSQGKMLTVTQADNPAPVGDDAPDPSIMRGFGPGRQFGKGSATGTPKPKVTDGQKPSARGILSRMTGFGASKK